MVYLAAQVRNLRSVYGEANGYTRAESLVREYAIWRIAKTKSAPLADALSNEPTIKLVNYRTNRHKRHYLGAFARF